MTDRQLPNWLACLIALLPGLSLLYLVKLSSGPLSTNVFEVIIYLTALLAWWQKPSWRHPSIQTIVVVALISLMTLVAVLIAPDKHQALGIVKGWIIPAGLAFWLLSRLWSDGRTREDWIRLTLIGMAAAGLINALAAVLERFSFLSSWLENHYSDLTQYLSHGRSVGLFNSPDSASMIIALGLLAGWSVWRGWPRYLTTGLSLIGLLLCASRGAELSVVVAWLVGELWQRRSRWAGLGLTALALLLVNPLVLSLIAERHPNHEDIRVPLWQASWQLITSRPWLGWGLGSFQMEFARLTNHRPNFALYITPYAIHPHNIWFYSWYLFGILGLAASVYLFIRYVLLSSKQSSWYGLSGGVFLVYLAIHGMVDNTVWRNDLLIWLAAAVVMITTADSSRSV